MHDAIARDDMQDEDAESGAQAEGAKCAQILQGARAVFLARGFDAASMGDIARAANVSKGTLYVYFENKNALFRALIADSKRSTAERLTVFDADDHDVAAVLTRFARRFIAELTDPAHVALVRMVVGAAEKFPDIGRTFFDAGPALGAQRLGAYLAAQAARGVLALDDPLTAAWQFLGMCNHPAMIATVMAGAPRPDAATAERYAEAAVRTFMQAHAPR